VKRGSRTILHAFSQSHCSATVLLTTGFIGRSSGQERMALFLHNHNGFFLQLSGDPSHHDDPENLQDSFGAQRTSFGPCDTSIGAGKCLSSTDAFYNYCKKDGLKLEDCQASVSKLSEAVGLDYDSETRTCFALFVGVGLTEDDLKAFCPKADEVAFYYPETSGFPVDAQSNVESFACFQCSRG
jgi:hypothetical protein